MVRQAFPEKTRLLDIGCGPGTGLLAFRELGFTLAAIEPDISRGKIAREKGFTVFGHGWESHDSTTSHDVVTCIHSLEHFHNTQDFLQKAAGFLDDDGILLIEVPNFFENVEDWNDSLYLAHMYNFHETTLTGLCEAQGWRLVGIILTRERI